MSFRRPRKRRRSQALGGEEEDDNVEQQRISLRLLDAQQGQDMEEAIDGDAEKLSRKEMEIWDVFREEHYEGMRKQRSEFEISDNICLAIEQLPLTLHRQYTLLQELDQQACSMCLSFTGSSRIHLVVDHSNELLPSIHQYVKLRQGLTPRSNGEQPAIDSQSAIGNIYLAQDLAVAPDTKSSQTGQSISPMNGSESLLSGVELIRAVPVLATRTSTNMPVPSTSTKPQMSREILSHIAWLSEEILRASDEKVNLAQAAYDSVGSSSISL